MINLIEQELALCDDQRRKAELTDARTKLNVELKAKQSVTKYLAGFGT